MTYLHLPAMAHVLLPDESLSRGRGRPAKYAATAVPLLLGEMERLGAEGPTVAKLVGGASMFGALLTTGGVNMGDRNWARVYVAPGGRSLPGVGRRVLRRAGHGGSAHRNAADRIASLAAIANAIGDGLDA